MERFRMPGLDLPKKDVGDALNKYRIKDSPGGAAALSPSPLSPTGSDSARQDDDELRSLTQQLATFNRRLTQDSLDNYRSKPKKKEEEQDSENEEEFHIDEEERRQLEAEMQRLLTRKHTLELRRSQRSAGATSDQAASETTATPPARASAGLDRFRVQSSDGGSGSAPVTPTATSSSSSSSLAAPVGRNRRLSSSGSDVRLTEPVPPPTAKPLSQTQVGLSASAPPRTKSPATAPNKPTTPTGTSTGGGVSFVTPKVKSSFGLPSRSSANANDDPLSKYRVQNNAEAPPVKGESKASTVVVVAEVRPLAPTVSDPFSKYRIAPSAGGGSGEATPLASPVAGCEAVRDVKPAVVDPLSKYRKQPNPTSSAAAPTSPPKEVAEKPAVSKLAIPEPSLASDEEGTIQLMRKSDEGGDGGGAETNQRMLCRSLPEKKSARDMLAEEEKFLWNNLARFSGDK